MEYNKWEDWKDNYTDIRGVDLIKMIRDAAARTKFVAPIKYEETHFKEDEMEQLNELFAALSKAQAEFPPIPRDATNPFFHSKYATLDGILSAVRPVLAKHGLSVYQIGCDVITPDAKGMVVGITTVLAHSSGASIHGEAHAVPKDCQPQTIGAAQTYLRRYGVQAILGICSEADDDGNSATHGTTRPPTFAASKPVPKPAAPVSKPAPAPNPAVSQPEPGSFDELAGLTGDDDLTPPEEASNVVKGKLTKLYKDQGTSKSGKAYTRATVYVNSEKYSTFDVPIIEALEKLQGKDVAFKFETNDKGFKTVTEMMGG